MLYCVEDLLGWRKLTVTLPLAWTSWVSGSSSLCSVSASLLLKVTLLVVVALVFRVPHILMIIFLRIMLPIIAFVQKSLSFCKLPPPFKRWSIAPTHLLLIAGWSRKYKWVAFMQVWIQPLYPIHFHFSIYITIVFVAYRTQLYPARISREKNRLVAYLIESGILLCRSPLLSLSPAFLLVFSASITI